MRHLTCTVALLAISLVQCAVYISPVTVPSEELQPPLRDAPDTFRKYKRSVKEPSEELEPPLDVAPVSFLGNEITKEVSPDPVHYLIPPKEESKYADYTQHDSEDLKQPLAPPMHLEPQLFRDPATPEVQSSNTTLPPIALPSEIGANRTSDIANSQTGNTTAALGGGNSTDLGDRSKRFIFPGFIFDDYGDCCDVCGRCGNFDAVRRRFRPRSFRRGGGRGRGRRRGVGRRFLPVYDDYDYDYGGGCGGCGRK